MEVIIYGIWNATSEEGLSCHLESMRNFLPDVGSSRGIEIMDLCREVRENNFKRVLH